MYVHSQGSAASAAYARFLERFFRKLEERGIRYCIPRNFEGLPHRVLGDVDVLVAPGQLRRAEAAATHLLAGSFVLRRLERKGHLLLWIADAGELRAAAREARPAELLELDLVTQLQWSGVSYLDGVAVLAAAELRDGLWVAGPAHRAVHILCHALLDKRCVKPEYRSGVEQIAGQLGSAALSPLDRAAGAGMGARLAQALARGDDAALLRLRGPLVRALLRRRPGAPAAWLRFQLREALRRLRAFIVPPGVLIATAGPDGVGKSTLLGRLREVLDHAYQPAREQYMGWREFVLPTKRLLLALQRARGKGGPRPTAGGDRDEPAVGGPVSWTHNFSVLHYFVDLWARYLLQIRPVLVRGGLVLCDRYFYDVLMQGVWLCDNRFARRLLLALTPEPTVTALLRGDAATIAARKQEMSPEETERHMRALAVLGGRASGLALDALKPVEENVEALLCRLFPSWPGARPGLPDEARAEREPAP